MPFEDDNPQTQSPEESGAGQPIPQQSYPQSSDTPEPPPSWKPVDLSKGSNQMPVYNNRTPAPFHPNQNKPNPNPSKNTDPNFDVIRKRVSIAQACAIVSLFIGGVLLSIVSLVFSIFAWKAYKAQYGMSDELREHGRAIKRSVLLTMGMSIVALVVNAVSLVLFYPMLVEMLQSGDFSSLGFGFQSNAPSGQGSLTWG